MAVVMLWPSRVTPGVGKEERYTGNEARYTWPSRVTPGVIPFDSEVLLFVTGVLGGGVVVVALSRHIV